MYARNPWALKLTSSYRIRVSKDGFVLHTSIKMCAMLHVSIVSIRSGAFPSVPWHELQLRLDHHLGHGTTFPIAAKRLLREAYPTGAPGELHRTRSTALCFTTVLKICKEVVAYRQGYS